MLREVGQEAKAGAVKTTVTTTRDHVGTGFHDAAAPVATARRPSPGRRRELPDGNTYVAPTLITKAEDTRTFASR